MSQWQIHILLKGDPNKTMVMVGLDTINPINVYFCWWTSRCPSLLSDGGSALAQEERELPTQILCRTYLLQPISRETNVTLAGNE